MIQWRTEEWLFDHTIYLLGESHKPHHAVHIWCTKMLRIVASWTCYMYVWSVMRYGYSALLYLYPCLRPIHSFIAVHVVVYIVLYSHQCCSGKLTHPLRIHTEKHFDVSRLKHTIRNTNPKSSAKKNIDINNSWQYFSLTSVFNFCCCRKRW